MKELTNKKLQNFIEKLTKKLTHENEYRDRTNQYDVPFIVATLYQNFENHENRFESFIEALNKWGNDYSIDIKSKREHDPNQLITFDVSKNQYGWENYNEIEPSYEFYFFYDDRPYGYCECTPDMPDYRVDKGCCGHNCDTGFSAFYLNKTIYVADGIWEGDAHDYWDFEDSFYNIDEDARKTKEKEMKENRIRELRKQIEEATKELMKLTEDN